MLQPSYFVSYSRQDREVVEKIRKGVEGNPQRFQIWFDEGIEPGEIFASKIQKKIAECSAVLFLASRNSVKSSFCLREINLADNKGKKIVPLRLNSEAELPEGDLPLQIQGVQYIDFSANFESGLRQLGAFLARELREDSVPPDTTGPLEFKTAPDHLQERSEQQQYNEKILGKWNRSGECRDLVNLAIGKQESGDLIGATLYCKAALEVVRQTGDKAWEARIWNILGQMLASLGQSATAIRASECVLKLTRDYNLQREIEVIALVNLAQCQAARSDDNQAEATCVGAYRIAQEIGYELGKSLTRKVLGTIRLYRGSYESAIEDLAKAKELSDARRGSHLQQTTRIELATALLLGDKIREAEATLDEALQYDTPLFSPEAHALRGVVRQRQGKIREAAGSFYDALDKAQEVLKQTSRFYRAHDVMGLSYCGLMLAEQTNDYLEQAIEAYEAAREITKENGIVRHRGLIFDTLARTDSGMKLAPVRKVIDPQH